MDITAKIMKKVMYEAISNVIKEEKELGKRVRDLISVLRSIIDWAGFELIGRIEIRDKKTRKEFRFFCGRGLLTSFKIFFQKT